MMKGSSLRGSLMILAATFIWGTAFVAQSMGMDYVSPFTFMACRFFVGAVVTLLPAMILRRKTPGNAGTKGFPSRGHAKETVIAGVLCGIVLFISSSLQQHGIMYTTVGKAGFITSLYVVLVPVAGLFMGQKAGKALWAAVAFSVAGMYLLCVREGVSVNLGDVMVLGCAFSFTVHIILVDRFAARVDALLTSSVQFFTVSALSALCMLVFEQLDISAVLACAWPILYTGVLSSGVAYTLQILAQREMDPAIAALLFSLESVFAALAGWVALNQGFSARELAGCGLVLVAVVIAQLPGVFRKRA